MNRDSRKYLYLHNTTVKIRQILGDVKDFNI